jgi:hypothetical protein
MQKRPASTPFRLASGWAVGGFFLDIMGKMAEAASESFPARTIVRAAIAARPAASQRMQD